MSSLLPLGGPATSKSSGLRKGCVSRSKPARQSRCSAQLLERVEEAPTLTPQLRRTTAVLELPNEAAPGGKTTVYVLAMSHVSAKSCDQIRELIASVKPEVVMVELCKDRIGLLIGDDMFEEGRKQVWHCPKITITGLPEGRGYPSADGLKSRLSCKPGKPVSTVEIEGDVVRLISSGLFKTVTPAARSGTAASAPLFWVKPSDEDDVELYTVPPLEEIEFRCEPRELPQIKSFSCRVDSSVAPLGVDLSQAQLDEVTQMVLQEAATDGGSTVSILMKASAELKDKAFSPAPIEVLFYGAETGVVEAVVHASRGHSDAVSGLEASAEGGEGVGIVPFTNPNRANDVKVGLTSRIPAEAVERIARSRQITANLATEDESDLEDPAVASTSAEAAPLSEEMKHMLKAAAKRSKTRPWTWKELATASDENPEPQPLKDLLANSLTGTYSKFQSKAADTVGIEGGQAWRVAFESAIQHGASQVLLGDRPQFVTQRRLAQGVWDGALPRVVAGLAALNLSVGAGTLGMLDGPTTAAAAGGSILLTLALLTPVLAPFWEVWRFSGMARDEIEAAVAVSAPIQEDLDTPMKLFGEDALLDWPGAMTSVIEERDEYMARALAAAALGRDGQVPAYVLDVVDGQPVARYMMPEGGLNMCAPTGSGDGAYQPVKGASAVVAVVGSAHVRGICKAWPQAQRDVSVKEWLQS